MWSNWIYYLTVILIKPFTFIQIGINHCLSQIVSLKDVDCHFETLFLWESSFWQKRDLENFHTSATTKLLKHLSNSLE